MKRLVSVLAMITATFAGSTLYLAHELRMEQRRSHEANLARHASQPRPEQPRAAEPLELPITEGAATTPVSASDSFANVESSVGGTSLSRSERRAVSRARLHQQRQEANAKLLKQYEDPLEREKMLANARTAARKQLERFPQLAGLTAAETNALLDLLAQQQVEDSVKVARCLLDTACATPQRALARLDKNAKSQQIADLLGRDKAERYEFFQSSMQERRGVTSLRAKLPDDQMLAEADAERLIEALARERQKYVSEAEQAGVRTGSLTVGGNAPVFYRQDQPARGQPRRFSPDMDSAVDFSDRMRKAASQVLTAEQMRVFNEMQDDLLSSLRQRYRAAQMRPPYDTR